MSTKATILFAENVNFHERNFKSLFDYIKNEKIVHSFMKPDKSMLSAFGNYYVFSDRLLSYKYCLDSLAVEDLLYFKYKNIDVFDVCKVELLSYLMPQYNWRSEQISSDDAFIISKAYNENREDLLWNMSAVLYWVDFIYQEIKNYKIHDYCCIFSGSIIYSRALLEILKTHQTKPLVLESFFTGNEYYMEFKYDSLPNNSDLKYKNIFNRYKLPENSFEYNKLKIKTINKIINSNNKNVKQPIKDTSVFNKLPKNYIVICGQVINDFSILGTQDNINSLASYKEMILDILEGTVYSVVFKAHPWEEHKSNVRCPLTYNELKHWSLNLDDEKRSRLCIENHISLSDLIMGSSAFITICSQSALEAAFRGYKPIIIGRAFYDGYGFTSNFSSSKDMVQAIQDARINFKLTFDEYKRFEEYMMVVLNDHLICVFNSGIIQLRQRFSEKRTYLSIKHKDLVSSIVVDNGSVDEKSVETKNQENQSIAVKEERKKEQSKKIVDIKSTSVKTVESNISMATKADLLVKNKKVIHGGISTMEGLLKSELLRLEDSTVRKLSSSKLYQKYKNGRKRFFGDVKNPIAVHYWSVIGEKIDDAE